MHLDLVSVFCRRDVDLQILQARSIARYFARQGVGRLFLVWNDAGPLPPDARGDLVAALGDFNHEITTAEELGVARDRITADGWTAQQAAKLLISRAVSHQHYLVLDSKNFFVAPCSVGDFINEDGRITFRQLRDLSGNELFRYALRYFDVQPDHLDPVDLVGVHNHTPFLLKTDVVRRMLLRIEGSSRCGVDEIFFEHQHRLTEFFAYQAFVISEGQRLSDLFQHTDRDVVTDIWWPHTAADDGIRKILDRVGDAEDSHARVVSVHWIAFILLSPAQIEALSKFLVIRDLAKDERTALDFIASVRRRIYRSNLQSVQFFRQEICPRLNPAQRQALAAWESSEGQIG